MAEFVGLFRAEWRKIIGNRLLMGCMVYVWPVVGAALVCVLTIAFALTPEARDSYKIEPFRWVDIALIPWFLLNNPLGRLLIIGFSVTIFAGEYQYRTWKTVLPGNPRWFVMIVKYITMGVFIVVAFVITSIIMVLLVGLMNLAFDATYPPPLNITSIGDFLRNYLLNAGVAFFTTLVIASIGILISIMTRSILIGLIAGMVISIIEFLGIPIMLAIAAALLRQEWIQNLVVIVPSYNADNIVSWINVNEPATYFDEQPLSLTESVGVLTMWLVGLVGLSIFVFQRQDID